MTRYVIDALRAAGVPAIRSGARVRARLRRALPEFRSAHPGRRRRVLLLHHRIRHQQSRPRRPALSQLRHHHGRRHPGAAGRRSGAKQPAPGSRRTMAGSSHHRDMDVPGFAGEAYRAMAARPGLLLLGRREPGVPRARKGSGRERERRPEAHRSAADGSWANPENLVKEDDPLIATAFAVRALAVGPDSVHRRRSGRPTGVRLPLGPRRTRETAAGTRRQSERGGCRAMRACGIGAEDGSRCRARRTPVSGPRYLKWPARKSIRASRSSGFTWAPQRTILSTSFSHWPRVIFWPATISSA